MAIYKAAGLYLEFTPRYERLRKYAEKYLYQGSETPSDVINLDIPEDFVLEKQEENPHLTVETCEYIWTGILFARKILERNGFVLHSSAISCDGEAYLFSADSGTGKSTHTKFWQEVFGKERTFIINDDKPAVREIDGKFYASGTMFSGKSPMSKSVSVPLKAICFIYRSETNEIRRLEVGEALPLLFEQTLRPKNEEKIVELLTILDSFLRAIPVYSLGVTLSPESAIFAYKAINDDISSNCK